MKKGAAFAVIFGMLATGCARSHVAATRGDGFVPASEAVVTACRVTARAVGYPVPCPTWVPAGLRSSGGAVAPSCALRIIGPGGVGGCAKSWRGWVIGSSTTSDEHLVITASPTRLRDDAKVVDGPAWYPGAHVRRLGRLSVNGWDVRAVFVAAATNEGSAFAHHVVLIWTVGQHTYGIGFHDVRGIRATLRLDEQLVRHIRLVGP